MPGWIYPFIWLFLWLIQSRLANQHSITKLLHGGSLIGFNLHNGGTLGKWGLNCFSISPSCRLDRFMDLKHVWGIDFIYFIIHWSVAPKDKQAVGLWQSREEHFSCPGLRSAPESNLRWEWENRFICRCRPLQAIHAGTRKAHPRARHRGHNIGYLWHMSCLSDQISFFFLSRAKITK